MRNKNTYKILTLFISSFLFTIPKAHTACHNLSGAYIGLGLGGNVAGNVLYSASENDGPIFKSTDSITGFLGGLILGIQKETGPVVIGAEIVTAYSDATAKTKKNGREFTADQNLSVELAARFGVKVAEATQVYFRLGVQNTEFKHKVPVNEQATGIKTKHKKRMTGLLLGVGIEGKITDSFMLGLEFRHTLYKEEKLNLKGDIAPIISATDRFKPSVSAVMVRLIYKIT